MIKPIYHFTKLCLVKFLVLNSFYFCFCMFLLLAIQILFFFLLIMIDSNYVRIKFFCSLSFYYFHPYSKYYNLYYGCNSSQTATTLILAHKKTGQLFLSTLCVFQIVICLNQSNKYCCKTFTVKIKYVTIIY